MPGHPMLFDNEKLFKKYEERKEAGFPCKDFIAAADVRENVKGKWVHDGRDFQQGCDWVHCSVCGKRGINVPADLTNYCPNCGADLRGENNGE